MWITVDDVISFNGLKPSHLELGRDDTEEMNKMVKKWIKQSMSLIKSYCNNPFKEKVPDAVQNVCLRLTSNMVNQAIARSDTPITKVDDWNISTVGSRIFTNDLKDDLSPWVIDKSNKSDKIEFFAITGEPNGARNHKRKFGQLHKHW